MGLFDSITEGIGNLFGTTPAGTSRGGIQTFGRDAVVAAAKGLIQQARNAGREAPSFSEAINIIQSEIRKQPNQQLEGTIGEAVSRIDAANAFAAKHGLGDNPIHISR